MKYNIGDKATLVDVLNPRHGKIGIIVDIKVNSNDDLAYIVEFKKGVDWYYKEKDLKPIYN